MNNLSDILKQAFEYKETGDYKKSIDFFYKALTLDNESSEIMSELAYLYSRLGQYDRACTFYEQISSKEPDNFPIKFDYACICEKIKDLPKAENLLYELFNSDYEINKTAEKLFSILIKTEQYEKLLSLFNIKRNSITSSKNYYYEALANLKLGNVNIADEYYQKSYNIDNSDFEAGLGVAQCLFEKKQYVEAEKVLNNILKFGENDTAFYLLAEISYLNGDLDKSAEYYSFAIKLEDKNPEYYFKLGLVFSLKTYFKEAEESFLKAISIAPQNIAYNYALAYLYYANKKYDMSMRITDYIMALDAENIQAIALKVILKSISNEAEKSRNYVNKLIEEQKKDDFSYYALALYYSKINLWEKALPYILKAIELNPSSLDYKYESALYYYNLKRFVEALNICEAIKKENKKYIQSYILASKIELELKNYINAEENVKIAQNLDNNNAEIHFIQGKIRFEQKNYEEAIKEFKIALSMNPVNDIGYAYMGVCCYNLKNYDDAYEYYKEASKIDILNASYRYYCAKCCIEKGDEEGAISNFLIMKRLNPSNIEYIIEFAQYLNKIGRKKTAKKLLESSEKVFKTKEEKNKIKETLKFVQKNC